MSFQGRYMAIYFPDFSLERCGYSAVDRACLVTPIHGVLRCMAFTPPVRQEGACEGMRLSEVLALVPDMSVEWLDVSGEKQDWNALLRVCLDFSPRVSLLWDAHIILEISGTTHLFSDEPSMLQLVDGLTRQLGHIAHIVIAGHPVIAAALGAHHGDHFIVPIGGMAEALAQHPLHILRPPKHIKEAIIALGIEKCVQWVALDPAAIRDRFGPEGTEWYQLAQGRPLQDPREWTWANLEPDLTVVSVDLGGVTSVLSIQFVLPGLLQDLVSLVKIQDRSIARLLLIFQIPSHPPQHVSVRLGSPSRNVEDLQQLVCRRLEDLQLPAPVESLDIHAIETVAYQPIQEGWIGKKAQGWRTHEVVAQIIDVLGEEAVGIPGVVDTWCPERSNILQSPWAGEGISLGISKRRAEDPVATQDAWESRLWSPRPTSLLSTPLGIQVKIQAGKPVMICIMGHWIRVDKVRGPEHIQGREWSEALSFDRVYWVVSVQQATAWIFSEKDRWYCHGWFD